MIKSCSVFFIFLFFCVLEVVAQDVHYSQFFNTPVLTNPSNTGVFQGELRAATVYRKQWSSVSGFSADYQTMAATVEGSLMKRKAKKGGFLGVGGIFQSDKAGDSQFGTSSFGLALNKVLSVSHLHDKFFSFSMDATFNQRSVNPAGLQWDNQWNIDHYDEAIPGESFGKTSFSYMDFRLGAMYFYTGSEYRKFHFGGTYSHLTRPNVSFFGKERLKPKLMFHGGGTFSNSTSNKVMQPSFYISKQGRHIEIVAGTFWRYVTQKGSRRAGFADEKAISIGGWYRYRDAIILAVRYEIKAFNVGISYDINVSNLVAASKVMGGPEITLLYKTAMVKNKRSGQFKNVRYL